MPNYPVTASVKDETVGTGANTNGTTLAAVINNALASSSYGYARLDTAAIGTDVISAATLFWYHDGYTKTKTVAFSRKITIGTATILDSTATPAAVGWHSEVLTAGEFAEINKTGETIVQFLVNDPGGSDFRSWLVRAWDFVPTGTYACYLDVTHAPASGGPTRFSILR